LPFVDNSELRMKRKASPKKETTKTVSPKKAGNKKVAKAEKRAKTKSAKGKEVINTVNQFIVRICPTKRIIEGS